MPSLYFYITILIIAAYIMYIIDCGIKRSVAKELNDIYISKSKQEMEEWQPFINKKYFIKCILIPFYAWVINGINLFKD